MNAQVTYCGAKGIEMGSEESQKYLEVQQTVYFAGKGAAEDILEQEEEEPDEEAEKKERGLNTKREISVLQVEIDEDVKCLTAVLGTATISSDGYKEAWEMLRSMEQKLKVDYKTLVGDSGENLEKTEADSEKEKAVKFMGEKTSLMGGLRTKMMMKSPQKVENIREERGTAGREERTDKRTIKTAPIPVPKWDGKTRSFPRFKNLWEENIIPHHDLALHMMLVQSLSKQILQEVSSLAGSFQEIWDHLEEKACKVDVISKDIMGHIGGGEIIAGLYDIISQKMFNYMI